MKLDIPTSRFSRMLVQINTYPVSSWIEYSLINKIFELFLIGMWQMTGSRWIYQSVQCIYFYCFSGEKYFCKQVYENSKMLQFSDRNCTFFCQNVTHCNLPTKVAESAAVES